MSVSGPTGCIEGESIEIDRYSFLGEVFFAPWVLWVWINES